MKKILFAFFSLFFSIQQTWAAVAFDARMTGGNGTGGNNQACDDVTTCTSTTGVTLGGSATCIVGMLVFASQGANTIPTGITMTWNGVAMTAGPSAASQSGADYALSVLFYLTNPATGQQVLSASWTNSNDSYMSAISFTGTATSACVNATNNITATQATSLAITSTTDGATVANFAVDGSIPTMNQTAIWAEAPLSPGGGGSYAIGGTSNSHTFTGAGGSRQAIAGVNVVAGAAAAATRRRSPILMGLPFPWFVHLKTLEIQ